MNSIRRRFYSIQKIILPSKFNSRFETGKWSHNIKLAKSLIECGVKEGFNKFTLNNSSISGTFLLDMDIHFPLRVLIYGEEKFDEEYIKGCIRKAFRKRQRLSREKKIETGSNNSYCLVFEGSDGLPGINIEVYSSYAFIKLYSKFWLRYIPLIAKELLKNDIVEGIYQMNKIRGDNYSIVHVEGKILPDESIVIEERGIKYNVNLRDTVSFGLYHDHRENRSKLIQLIKNKPSDLTMLSTFSHTCGFSLSCSKENHKIKTVNVDSSKEYLDIGKKNFVLNDIDLSNHKFISEDVFKFIEENNANNIKYDVVIIDPPPVSFNTTIGTFSTKYHYDRLITLAKPLVKEGGFLICFDTYKLTTKAEWLSKIKSVLNEDWKKIFELSQSYDYPVRKHDSASSYLKGIVLKYK